MNNNDFIIETYRIQINIYLNNVYSEIRVVTWNNLLYIYIVPK